MMGSGVSAFSLTMLHVSHPYVVSLSFYIILYDTLLKSQNLYFTCLQSFLCTTTISRFEE